MGKRFLTTITAPVWLAQEASSRVDVPADQRTSVRRAIAAAYALLGAAKESSDASARIRCAAEALSAMLGAHALATNGSVAESLERLATQLPETDRSALTLAAPAPDATLSDATFHALERAIEFVAASLDARSPREILLGRALPVAAGAVAILIALGALFGAKNLALGSSVSASSICGYTPPEPFKKPRLERVVDGVRREAMLAACTNLEKNAFIMVDLGSERRLDDVVVYGRSDCCWGKNDLPVELQVAGADRKFAKVSSTETPFTDELPWRVDLGGRRARYVRLQGPGDRTRSLVVNEIEVHGR